MTDDPDRALALVEEAWSRDDVDAVVAHLSAAIRGFTARGEPCRAAMACVQLGGVMANFLGNLVASRAWFARARRLVEDQPPCVEQGWVAVAAMGCDVGDPVELLAAADLALDRARRFGDVNLETKALADGGLALVQAGRIAEGFARLDESMALATGPADDLQAAGQSVCSFLTACYYAAEFERAGSWADLLRRHGLIGVERGTQLFLSNHCDAVQATLLCELGRWNEAERVLTRASAAFERVMGPSWHSAIALADLRIRQGRLAEAERLLLGRDQAFEALLPMARLHLARGDLELARAAATRGLRALGGDRLRALELLTVLVDVELSAGDTTAAKRAAEELSARAEPLDAPPLRARADAARARVLGATGEARAGVALLERSVDRLDASLLPWLTATTRLQLARLREADGDRAGAVVDARAAAALLQALDVVVGPEDTATLGRLVAAPSAPVARSTATIVRAGDRWVVEHAGTTARLQPSKGLRYVAALVARPGAERHALDLVDEVEGVDAGGLDRRHLGDAGELADASARQAYRRRIEALRAAGDDALAAGRLEEAERIEAEIDALVGELARAFGVDGRARTAASAAERARLNVTRALRTATAKIAESLPEAGAVLDRRVRTGTYCAYEPAADDPVRWIVQSGVNGPASR